jgi:hypothetical protein
MPHLTFPIYVYCQASQPCLILLFQFTLISKVMTCLFSIAFAFLSHASLHLPNLHLFSSILPAWLSLRSAMPHCMFPIYIYFQAYHLHGFRFAQPRLIAPSQFTSILKCITCIAFALLSHAVLHLPNLHLFPSLSRAWLSLCSAMLYCIFPIYIYFQTYHMHGFRFTQPCLISLFQSQVNPMHGFRFAQPCHIASSQFTFISKLIMCMAFTLLSHA